MAISWQASDPHRLEAACSRGLAEQLARFDHHRAVVQDRWAILICYHWLPLEERTEPFLLRAILNPAPTHLPTEAQVRAAVMNHPLVPPEIQRIVETLRLAPPPTTQRAV